jgi:hypothetical protein
MKPPALSPDWDLTQNLHYLRRKIELCMVNVDYNVEAEEIQGLATAIHSHPMISEFSSETAFPFASLGPWCSALGALPSLERFIFGLAEPDTED